MFDKCLWFVLEKRRESERVLGERVLKTLVNLVSNSSVCFELQFRVSVGC